MQHSLSSSDQHFYRAFMDYDFPLQDFDHRAHIRFAYILLCRYPVDEATDKMRAALTGALQHHGMATDKYHETLTRAWLAAVRHFMHLTAKASDADDFILKNEALLDTRIMLSHYSSDRLFADAARKVWMEPDLEAIPEYPDDAA